MKLASPTSPTVDSMAKSTAVAATAWITGKLFSVEGSSSNNIPHIEAGYTFADYYCKKEVPYELGF